MAETTNINILNGRQCDIPNNRKEKTGNRRSHVRCSIIFFSGLGALVTIDHFQLA